MVREEKKKDTKDDFSSYDSDEDSEEEEREEEPAVVVTKATIPAPAGSGPAGSGKPPTGLGREAAPALPPPVPPRPPRESPGRRAESEGTEEADRAPRARALKAPRSPSPRAEGATPKSKPTGHKGHGGKGEGGKGGRPTCFHCWKPLGAYKSGQDQHTYWNQACLEWQFRNIGYTRRDAGHAAHQLKQERMAAYEAHGGHVPFPADPFYGASRGNHGSANAEQAAHAAGSKSCVRAHLTPAPAATVPEGDHGRESAERSV